ncbi:MAG: PGF-CTERM sorting domain-containing protein [Candidatus Kariarchaeaceae archaeon]|jgi:hypothetical protein
MKQNKILLTILFLGIVMSLVSLNPSLTTAIEIPQGEFDLNIYQDNHAAIGETGYMSFDVYSNFNVSMDVNISLILATPSGDITLYNQAVTLPEWGSWYDDVYYTFTEMGYYEVLLYVIDGFGREWKTDCWWEVSEPWFDLWIWQDNYASVGDTGEMSIDIQSHFSTSMNVSAKVAINTPNGTEILIYEDNSISLVALDYWYDYAYYTFTEAGHYEVIFSVSDGFGYWETYCWWEVYDEQEYLALWIHQDNYRMVNEFGWMDFTVENRFTTNKTVSILILLIGPNGETLLANETVFLDSWNRWYFYTEYLFIDPGYYDVVLLVTDHSTSRVWEYWCWWEIHDGTTNGGYELFIDQEYNAKVGETKWMHFKAQSHFGHDMPSVIIKIRMEDPTGYTELLLEVEVSINANSVWEIDLNYTFTQVGAYIVHFELYDDIRNEWYTNCEWMVKEPGPGIYVDGPASVDVDETFTIKGSVYSGFEYELHIKNVTLAWENGTVIETVNVSRVIPQDSYSDSYFNVSIPVSGEYTFLITADTSKGLLEANYSVKVGIIDDNTTDPERDTNPILTPGFESIFGLLALFIAIPLIRKSRR